MRDSCGAVDEVRPQAPHRQGIGRIRYGEVEPTRVTTLGGATAWHWIGADERGRELETIAIAIAIDIGAPDGESYLLVIHVMPTQLRG